MSSILGQLQAKLLQASEPTTAQEAYLLQRDIQTTLEQWIDQAFFQEPPTTVVAEEITVKVQDQFTGQVFSRQLPLDYYENDNGIRLGGETIDGNPTAIVLLSHRAMDKMKDLTGHGPDQSRCEGHE